MLDANQINLITEKSKKIASKLFNDIFDDIPASMWGIEIYNNDNTYKLFKNNFGDKTLYEFNDKGDVVRVIEDGGSSQKYTYNKDGSLDKIICTFGKNNYITEYKYDENGNKISVIKYVEYNNDTKNREEYFKVEYEYDKNKNLVKAITTDPYSDQDVHIYKYDKNNRVIFEKSSDGYEKVYRYDNNTTTIISSDGSKTINRYDEKSRLTFVEELETSNIYDKIICFSSYEFDDNDNLIYERRVLADNSQIDVEYKYNDKNQKIYAKCYDPRTGEILAINSLHYNDDGRINFEIYYEDTFDVSVHEYHDNGKLMYSVVLTDVKL